MPATAERTQRLTYTRPWMAGYQTDAIFCPERYGVVEASTKSGKTVGSLVWLLEQTMPLKTGQNTYWVAPIYAQAQIPFERMKLGIPRELYHANETKLTITLPNEAVVWFKGGDKPDSLYGDDVMAAVIDEASRVKEEAWHAVRSTLTATRGPIRIIGNVKGRKNWAYKLARRAEAGEPGMHYAKITAYDAVAAGVLEQAEIDDARSKLPEAVFRELYEAVPSDDEGNPFGYAAIRACIGRLHLECRPFVWGWDLARAMDWVVGIALCGHGAVCRFERWNQSNLPETRPLSPTAGDAHQAYWAVTIRRVRDLTAGAPAMNDSTGPGGPVDQALNAGLTLPNFEGHVSSAASKQQLMEGLAVAIQSRELTYPEGVITLELEAFEYVYTRTGVKYSAPEGMHDDAVVALALAREKLVRQRSGQGMARGLAEMIRTGQAVTVSPERRDPNGPQTTLDWLRNAQ